MHPHRLLSLSVALVALAGRGGPARAGGAPSTCPPDSVLVGPICVDRYEASVWELPAENDGLQKRVLAGTSFRDDLLATGAVQHGCLPGQTAFPRAFPKSGDWKKRRYAVSAFGTTPTTCVSWYQAEQACRISGKRLLTSQEWQAAVAGTPDRAGKCNIAGGAVATSGSLPGCSSRWGVADMIGNVAEWVGDVNEEGTMCVGAPAGEKADLVCLTGGSNHGALVRGGSFASGSDAGAFAMSSVAPLEQDAARGFRCARLPSPAGQTCPEDQLVVGFSPEGNILCEPAGCPVSVPDSVTYSDVTVSNVKINGGANAAQVAPGATFEVTLDYSIVDCACPGCIDQIEVGLATAAGPAGCVYDASPGCSADIGSGAIQIQAPTKAGVHRIGIDRAQDFQCLSSGSGWGTTPPGVDPQRIIAAICVR